MGAMNALVAQPMQRVIQGVLADRAPIATTGEEIFVIANASVASQTALAVSTALLGGARKADLPMDLNVLAEAAIVRTAEGNSKRPDLSALASSANITLNFETAAAKAKAAGFENVVTGFDAAVQITGTALGAVVTHQAKVLDAMQRYMQIQDEELQMLWWLVGERSLDFGCRFDEVDADARPFVFAKELGDLTQYLPDRAESEHSFPGLGLRRRKSPLLALSMPPIRHGFEPSCRSAIFLP
jgi:hypothetical protein